MEEFKSMSIFSARVIRLIVIGISAVLVVNLSRSIWDLWKRRDILGERQAVLGRLDEENKRLQRELEKAQSPAFIEQEARNRLGLGREGEGVILIRPIRPITQSDQLNTEEKHEEKLPKWKRWWKLFF